MTSQIVLMNKLGVAVGSDSSLTMEVGDNRRTYSSAEKIHPLGPEHKIAVLHSGSTQFMGHPYEILISQWKKTLTKPLARVDDYVTNWISWLTHRQDLFPEDEQIVWFKDVLEDYFLDLRKRIIDYTGSNNIFKDNFNDPEVLEWVNGFLSGDIEWLDGQQDLASMDSAWAETKIGTLRKSISEVIEYVFDDVPRDAQSDEYYWQIAQRFLYKYTYHHTEGTLAFVGFGDSEIYPAHTYLDFLGVIADKPRYLRNSDAISLETSSRLRTHAQAEAIHTFLRAYHKNFESVAKVNIDKTFDTLLQVEGLNDLPDEILTEIERVKSESKSALESAFAEESTNKFVDPFTSTLAGLPTISLGNMAASLIQLQVLRQTSTAIQDTVGGPIDVGVITLENGFQWFKHKTVEEGSRGF